MRVMFCSPDWLDDRPREHVPALYMDGGFRAALDLKP
jgi:hypothetical protein